VLLAIGNGRRGGGLQASVYQKMPGRSLLGPLWKRESLQELRRKLRETSWFVVGEELASMGRGESTGATAVVTFAIENEPWKRGMNRK